MRFSRRTIILVSASLVLLAMLIPVPIEAEARGSRKVELKSSFWKCCQSLVREDVRDQLAKASGPGTGQATIEKIAGEAGSKSTLQATLMDLFKGKFQTTENLRVTCETELGPVVMLLRQDAKLEANKLGVTTRSCEPVDNVLNYAHCMQLQPVGDTCVAEVDLEIKIRITVPWSLKRYVHYRLNRSLNRQLNNFSSTLSKLLNEQPASN